MIRHARGAGTRPTLAPREDYRRCISQHLCPFDFGIITPCRNRGLHRERTPFCGRGSATTWAVCLSDRAPFAWINRGAMRGSCAERHKPLHGIASPSLLCSSVLPASCNSPISPLQSSTPGSSPGVARARRTSLSRFSFPARQRTRAGEWVSRGERTRVWGESSYEPRRRRRASTPAPARAASAPGAGTTVMQPTCDPPPIAPIIVAAPVLRLIFQNVLWPSDAS